MENKLIMTENNKIPPDLKRWLKDNGYYSVFLKVLRHGAYTVTDLLWKTYKGSEWDYGVKDYLSNSTGMTRILTLKDGSSMHFEEFLKNF